MQSIQVQHIISWTKKSVFPISPVTLVGKGILEIKQEIDLQRNYILEPK
jgi:hypothetical protein